MYKLLARLTEKFHTQSCVAINYNVSIVRDLIYSLWVTWFILLLSPWQTHHSLEIEWCQLILLGPPVGTCRCGILLWGIQHSTQLHGLECYRILLCCDASKKSVNANSCSHSVPLSQVLWQSYTSGGFQLEQSLPPTVQTSSQYSFVAPNQMAYELIVAFWPSPQQWTCKKGDIYKWNGQVV